MFSFALLVFPFLYDKGGQLDLDQNKARQGVYRTDFEMKSDAAHSDYIKPVVMSILIFVISV